MQECGIWGIAVKPGIQTLQFPGAAAMVRQVGHMKRITAKAGTYNLSRTSFLRVRIVSRDGQNHPSLPANPLQCRHTLSARKKIKMRNGLNLVTCFKCVSKTTAVVATEMLLSHLEIGMIVE